MKRVATRLTVLASAMAILAGCVGAQPIPSPTSSPTPAPTTDPGAEGYLLRATEVQALPPESRFGWFPVVAITHRLELLEAAAVPAIFPGPLVQPFFARVLSQRGYAAIIDEARAMGLLSGRSDFTPPDVAPGARLGRIELVADGQRFDLVGDPTRLVRCAGTRCVPEPGTPEAFAAFWQRIGGLWSWLESELGPAQPYVAPAFALLVEPPMPTDGMAPRFATWPLPAGLLTAGQPIGTGQLPRCVTVRGGDADAVRPVLGGADQLTRFVESSGAPAGGVSLRVRPLLLGEDHCLELFGLET
jgi:hypothetical protein